MSTHPRRCLALALTLGALLAFGAANPPGAVAAKPPSFLLDRGDHWFTHDVGWYPVVQGPAELVFNGRRTPPMYQRCTRPSVNSGEHRGIAGS